MAFKSSKNTRTLLGDFSLSPKLSNVSLPHAVEMLECTTHADTAKRYVPGQDSSEVSMTGFLDAETATDAAAWTSNTPLTIGLEGLAVGSPVFMTDSLRASYEIGSPVGGLVSFDFGATTDGVTAIGVSLHDLTARTTDANGTSHDGSAASTAGAIAHLHVTAFSGLTSNVVTIEDSADNSTFATIGTFTTVTGLTSQRLEIAGTIRRYVRAVWNVTGTGSTTFAVAFCRR